MNRFTVLLSLASGFFITCFAEAGSLNILPSETATPIARLNPSMEQSEIAVAGQVTLYSYCCQESQIDEGVLLAHPELGEEPGSVIDTIFHPLPVDAVLELIGEVAEEILGDLGGVPGDTEHDELFWDSLHDRLNDEGFTLPPID